MLMSDYRGWSQNKLQKYAYAVKLLSLGSCERISPNYLNCFYYKFVTTYLFVREYIVLFIAFHTFFHVAPLNKFKTLLSLIHTPISITLKFYSTERAALLNFFNPSRSTGLMFDFQRRNLGD